jgi:hypothetical protein
MVKQQTEWRFGLQRSREPQIATAEKKQSTRLH